MIYKRPETVDVTESDYLALYETKQEAKNRLFNIGAGVWEHPCWTNMDLPPQSEAFAAVQSPCIHIDLIKDFELPLPSESVDNFYCSHVVEHLPEIVVQNMLLDTYRCLRPGGCVRIATGPCADLDWQALQRGDMNWWFWMNDQDFIETVQRDLPPMTIYDRWLHHVATPRSVYSETECEIKYNSKELKNLINEHLDDPEPLLELLTKKLQFNYQFPGNHISWWNFTKLKLFLKNAGFKTIIRSAYGQSTSQFMRDLAFFDQTYPQISVYVEAIK